MCYDMMKDLLGKVVRIDRGGPESRIGQLLDVCDDFVVLLTAEEGLVYYNIHQIKSVTENIRGQMNINSQIPKDYKKASTLLELIESLKFKWVRINRGGPEKIEGLLSGLDHGFICLVRNEEIIRISKSHIKNISYIG